MTINATGNRMTGEIARQSRLAENIAQTQISISTRKRFQSASEAPLAAARVSDIGRAQADSASWSANLSIGAARAAQADSVLARLSDRFVHAREVLLAGASGTATVSDRATYATELRSIAAEVADFRATTTPDGTALFATGTALRVRVDAGVLIAPVDSAANIFENGGVALTRDLTDAAAALDSGDAARIGVALERLSRGIDHVADAAADQGLRGARIDTLTDTMATRDIDLAAERSGLEDTDLTTAIATLNAQMLTLDAAQAAFARINRRSLFDILG